MSNQDKLRAIAAPEFGERLKSVLYRLTQLLGWPESRVRESWYERAVWTATEHEQVDAMLDELELRKAASEELRHALQDLRSRLDDIEGRVQSQDVARPSPAFDWLVCGRAG